MILINDNYNGSSIWNIDKDKLNDKFEIIISDETLRLL